jgi:RHS repeat-associated protein
VDEGTTASFVYNALGQRVEKRVGSTYTEYVWAAYGELDGLHDRTNWAAHFIPFGGRVVAMYKDGTTYFVHPNHLGSTTTVFNHTGGSVAQDEIFYPWGERWNYAGTLCDERFAAMQLRDAESGLDPTLFRMYESRLYRWLSPDPLAGEIFNPQSLNRYAYVLNNPVNLIDPLGLQGCPGWAGMWQCVDPHHAFTGPPPVKLGFFWGGSRWLYSAVTAGWTWRVTTIPAWTAVTIGSLGEGNEIYYPESYETELVLMQGVGTNTVSCCPTGPPPGPCQPPAPGPQEEGPSPIRTWNKLLCAKCRADCAVTYGGQMVGCAAAGGVAITVYGAATAASWTAPTWGKAVSAVVRAGARRAAKAAAECAGNAPDKMRRCLDDCNKYECRDTTAGGRFQ